MTSRLQRRGAYARRLPSPTPDPRGHDWSDGTERTELGESITRCRGCGACRHWLIATREWCSRALRKVVAT